MAAILQNTHARASACAAALGGRPSIDGKAFTRGGQRLRIQGVTYGPFDPADTGEPFPLPSRVRSDFTRMREVGVNSVRTYHLPPDWLLDLADEQGMLVLVDVPWPKHVCFLDSQAAMAQARTAVLQAALRGRRHPCVLAYSVGNEIRPDTIRWHGAARVERFIADLSDVVRQADPPAMVTYASFPSTEYLDLSCLDFATFNVYLHDRETFRRYLLRLQNLVGERPLVLGEIGMDSLRHGESGQAEFLAGHLREAALAGLAGAFVFSWTDDWHTGGHRIEDWAFGVTTADRSPKPALESLAAAYAKSPAAMLDARPRVSVVVCSYNGARTLDQCLRSLEDLDYPDYEVILVDDGSTDDTREIASRHPSVRYLHQANLGLSVARNTGLHAATGTIVAYTDSDCYADRDWLSLLVSQLERTGADAVGGPNLTPDDGWLAACVAASPGQPTHVLESDQAAEHIPGCNMAFRKEALEAINGFDARYRKAGDDVDVCWRLQQAGMWITFAPGAFVWHHRRQNPRTYLRQQAGYGEAEALLWFEHPDRFNSRGDGKWQGVMYGQGLQGLRFGRAVIYRGAFATGLFQTLYRPAPAHWASLPATLEWHIAAALLAISAIPWHGPWGRAWAVSLGMLLVSLVTASLQAAQAALPARYHGLRSRLVVAALCYAQPLARSWARYRTRLFPPSARAPRPDIASAPWSSLRLAGTVRLEYWDEKWRDRTELLEGIVRHLTIGRWTTRLDSGWANWDVVAQGHPWTVVHLLTAQEDHGSGRRLVRVRARVRASDYSLLVGGVGVLAAAGAWGLHAPTAALLAGLLAVASAGAWLRGIMLASRVLGTIDCVAAGMGLVPCGGSRARQRPVAVVRPREDADAG